MRRCDQAETIFLEPPGEGEASNLTGMPINKRNVVRPLMFASKKMEIRYRQHANWNGVRIVPIRTIIIAIYPRHQIFRIHKINPGLNESLRTSREGKGEMLIFEIWIKMSWKLSISKTSNDGLAHISKTLFLINFLSQPLLGVYWMNLVLRWMRQRICWAFYTSNRKGRTHKLVVDRDEVIVLIVDAHFTWRRCADNRWRHIQTVAVKQLKCKITNEPSTNTIEAKLTMINWEFPAGWRTWRDGDHFMPLGEADWFQKGKRLFDWWETSLPEKRRQWLSLLARLFGWWVEELMTGEESTGNKAGGWKLKGEHGE